METRVGPTLSSGVKSDSSIAAPQILWATGYGLWPLEFEGQMEYLSETGVGHCMFDRLRGPTILKGPGFDRVQPLLSIGSKSSYVEIFLPH